MLNLTENELIKKYIYLFWVYHNSQAVYSLGRGGKREKLTSTIMRIKYNTTQPTGPVIRREPRIGYIPGLLMNGCLGG